jgi:hypothetical protein
MRIVPLSIALCLAPALCAHAAPPSPSPSAPPQDIRAQAPVSHNRIGEIMDTLTRALREAAEQRQQARQALEAHPAPAPSTAAATPAQANSLPETNAQAAVP